MCIDQHPCDAGKGVVVLESKDQATQVATPGS